MTAVDFRARIYAFLARYHHDPIRGRINQSVSTIPQLVVHDDMRVADVDAWEALVEEVLTCKVEDRLDPHTVYTFIGRIPRSFPAGLPFNTQNQLTLYYLRRAIDAYGEYNTAREEALARRRAEHEEALARRRAARDPFLAQEISFL